MPRIVLAGKFKGSTYTEVLANHRPYCLWVLESADLPSGLQAFKRWLASRFGGIMAVGKYKLKTFREIVDEDPAYCVWVCDLVSPTDAMQRFQALGSNKPMGASFKRVPNINGADVKRALRHSLLVGFKIGTDGRAQR